MKQTRIASLLFALTHACALAREIPSTNKTFLSFRDQHHNTATLAGYSDVRSMKSEDRLDGSLLATGFFTASMRGNELGEAYGAAGLNDFLVGTNAADNVNAAFITRSPTPVGDLFPPDNVSQVELKLAPEQKVGGAKFSYYQHLEGIEEGLYFAVHVPVLFVRNNIKPTFSREVVDPIVNMSLEDFFAGEGSSKTPGNLMNPLTKSKIDQGGRSKGGVADVQIVLGYNFLYDTAHHLGVDLSLYIPTGSSTSGEFAFEPVLGSRHYWLGLGLNADIVMWHKKNHALHGYFDCSYHFILKNDEVRPIGVKGIPFGHYYQAGKYDGRDGVADIPFFPATNVLTQAVNVHTTGVFEGILGLSYRHRHFKFDIGYNLYFKESERISLKDEWVDGIYFIPRTDVLSNAAITPSSDPLIELRLDKDNLDLDAATSRAQFTNKVFIAFTYTSRESDYPLTFGLGASYEYADNKRTALDGYCIFAKAGVSF